MIHLIDVYMFYLILSIKTFNYGELFIESIRIDNSILIFTKKFIEIWHSNIRFQNFHKVYPHYKNSFAYQDPS